MAYPDSTVELRRQTEVALGRVLDAARKLNYPPKRQPKLPNFWRSIQEFN
jgi:hypothetical protein